MEQHPQGQQQLDGPGAAPGGKRDPATPDPARRSFLKAAPLGALAVVSGSTGAAEAPAAVPTAPAPQVKRGYHETEHIRRYYETARYW